MYIRTKVGRIPFNPNYPRIRNGEDVEVDNRWGARMRKELIDLLYFLKSGYVVDSRTIHTCSHIDDEIMKGYADTIEKILSNDVILVDKNKLENKFEEQPVDMKSDYITIQKDFFLRTQIRLAHFEYYNNNKELKEYVNKMLTNKLLDYFISEVGVEKDNGE